MNNRFEAGRTFFDHIASRARAESINPATLKRYASPPWPYLFPKSGFSNSRNPHAHQL